MAGGSSLHIFLAVLTHWDKDAYGTFKYSVYFNQEKEENRTLWYFPFFLEGKPFQQNSAYLPLWGDLCHMATLVRREAGEMEYSNFQILE